MKISFFLLPKAETTFVSDNNSVRQVIEKMSRSNYSAIPVLSETGGYLYTITARDILWYLKNNPECCFRDTERVHINDVKRTTEIAAVNAAGGIEEVLTMALEQNFVPVVDDFNTYIGMVRRRELIQYLMDGEHLAKKA